jgi:hypothetical protein
MCGLWVNGANACACLPAYHVHRPLAPPVAFKVVATKVHLKVSVLTRMWVCMRACNYMCTSCVCAPVGLSQA